MNKRTQQHVKRDKTVILTIEEYLDLLTGKTKVLACYNNIKAELQIIEENHQIQMADLTGITETKTDYAAVLEECFLKVNGPLVGYLQSIPDMENLKKFNYTGSQFSKLPEISKMSASNKLYEFVTDPIKTILIDKWELTDEDMPNLLSAKTNYSNSMSKPSLAIAERSVATKNIYESNQKINKILLPEFQNYMLMFRFTQPEFYATFENAMKITDPAYRKRKTTDKSTSVKGKTISLESGHPMKDVKVYDEANPENFTLSDANGNFTLIFKAAGTYTIVAEYPGYYSDEDTIDVELDFEYIMDDFELEIKGS